MSTATDVLACPACGGSESIIIGNGPAFEVSAQNHYFYHPAYAIAGCQICHLLYKTKRLSDAQLEDYYRNELDYRQLEIPGLYPTERRILKVFPPKQAGLNILDFGCSSGRLLSKLAGRHKCYGVEPNKEASRAATEKGVEILAADDIESKGLLFDAVILADVYEHLQNPLVLLKKMLKHLNPGGALIIATGCSDGMAGHDIAQCWYFRILGHLNMMSIKHVQWLGSALGMRIDSLNQCSHYDSNCANRAKQLLRYWLYYQVNSKSSWMGRLIRRTKVGKKVSLWKAPPALDLQNDHVVICYQKND